MLHRSQPPLALVILLHAPYYVSVPPGRTHAYAVDWNHWGFGFALDLWPCSVTPRNPNDATIHITINVHA